MFVRIPPGARLRKRRLHDLRRSCDGGRKDILRWITHGPSGDIMDSYTTLPWDALCAEVTKLRIEVREGRLLKLPKVAIAGDVRGDRATPSATQNASAGNKERKKRKCTGIETYFTNNNKPLRHATLDPIPLILW